MKDREEVFDLLSNQLGDLTTREVFYKGWEMAIMAGLASYEIQVLKAKLEAIRDLLDK